jgi:hypothetical protein
MGYYTKYDLESSDRNAETHKENIATIVDFKWLFHEDCKWYEHIEDMKEYSKKYPKVLFTLSGHGEDYEDIWKKYFLNGKVQIEKARITFDNFDKNKLT